MNPRDEFLGCFSIAGFAWVVAALFMFVFPALPGHFWDYGIKHHLDNVVAVALSSGFFSFGAFVLGGLIFSALCGVVFGYLSSFVPVRIRDFVSANFPPRSPLGLFVTLVLVVAFLIGVVASTYLLALMALLTGSALI
ncbi:hypothetical protein NA8A_05628 [Nitratireductor indicus C115]|uniref:Transmembrane protein n=1 Tax=Nitratireductor indicus C115 TaxID=1231190 RepID=K2PR27_9HYPH|nr:hypothetical protein [Nitratireductor indicus]EKF43487.1 hypothetical protein NA8A_05628 [Nitratireductor indicus C115]SFQ06546.1 hypothetical protein SAMN05216176_101179 [Nitratireductor indicus]